jgi:predicted enzyme related to lactoylglutathione lyase
VSVNYVNVATCDFDTSSHIRIKSQAITLQVDDIQATVAELKSRGVEFAQEPFDTPWGIFATFLDQDKNQLLLVQEK